MFLSLVVAFNAKKYMNKMDFRILILVLCWILLSKGQLQLRLFQTFDFNKIEIRWMRVKRQTIFQSSTVDIASCPIFLDIKVLNNLNVWSLFVLSS